MAKRHGYEFIKLYNSPSREQFLAVTDEARKQRIGVVGHGVRAVGLPEALFLGQSMVAHAEELYYTAFQNREDEKLNPSVVAEKPMQSWPMAIRSTPSTSSSNRSAS